MEKGRDDGLERRGTAEKTDLELALLLLLPSFPFLLHQSLFLVRAVVVLLVGAEKLSDVVIVGNEGACSVVVVEGYCVVGDEVVCEVVAVLRHGLRWTVGTVQGGGTQGAEGSGGERRDGRRVPAEADEHRGGR